MVIPEPKQVALQAGKGLPFGKLRFVHLKGGTHRPILGSLLDPLPETGRDTPDTLVLRLDQSLNEPESPEGYQLGISADHVEVASRGLAGLFYGCQTLEQLLEDARDTGSTIPACRIVDYPAMPYRAVHLDVKHHLDTMQYYYECVDRLARYKINGIVFEFEDKLRYRRRPAIGAANAMSIEEMAAFTRYARERHIEVTPLIQGLGHASFILKHGEYSHLRDDPESDWAFCALNDGTYEVLFDLYRDAIEATPGSRHLHVGGDEVGRLGGSALATGSGMSAVELQMHWLRRVCAFAAENGRMPIVWDDMILKLGGVYLTTHSSEVTAEEAQAVWRENHDKLDAALALFPANCTFMRWNYDEPKLPGNVLALQWYKQHGLMALAATAAQTTWPMFPRNRSNIRAIRDFCDVATTCGLDGVLCTAWDDASPSMETYWRGWIAHAEYAWSPGGRSLDEYARIYRHREFGPRGGQQEIDFQDELGLAMGYWDTALLDEGVRDAMWRTRGRFELMKLPARERPGIWKQRYGERLGQAAVEIRRHQQIKQAIDSLRTGAVRNRRTLRLMAAINDMQIHTARILLAIAACDSDAAGDAERDEVRTLLSQFEDAKTRLLSIFGKTRFLNNPVGYRLDSNHQQTPG